MIDRLLVSICGGIQPDRLRQFRDLTDDGLWQRFIPIIVGPESVGRDEPNGAGVHGYDSTIERLLALPSDLGVLEMSPGAYGIRMDVERELFELGQSEPLGPKFAGFVGKLGPDRPDPALE